MLPFKHWSFIMNKKLTRIKNFTFVKKYIWHVRCDSDPSSWSKSVLIKWTAPLPTQIKPALCGERRKLMQVRNTKNVFSSKILKIFIKNRSDHFHFLIFALIDLSVNIIPDEGGRPRLQQSCEDQSAFPVYFCLEETFYC